MSSTLTKYPSRTVLWQDVVPALSWMKDVGIKYTKLCSPVILYSFSSDTTMQELSIQEKPVQNYVVPERKVKSF